ncbi:RNA polymerase sigma factor [Gaoshiqia sp. Z1-71]|uniref:RNA polymerase sigma factor n=1 Tax=Gaoshiqia hydrogeniformans TaxID=3290090 RepID=UPI003BF7B995
MFLKSKHKTDLTDEEIVLQYKRGNDQELLAHLYGRYVTLVFGLCLKYFSDREQSKDLVMQIFEKLAVDLHRHEVRQFRSWLYVTSKNHCLMELRKRESLRKREKDWVEKQAGFVEFQHQTHPIEDGVDLQLNEALRDCLNRLKEEQRQCLHWFYYESKSYREITGLTGLEEQKVKSLLQNGKRNLKICLEKKHVGSEIIS